MTLYEICSYSFAASALPGHQWKGPYCDYIEAPDLEAAEREAAARYNHIQYVRAADDRCPYELS